MIGYSGLMYLFPLQKFESPENINIFINDKSCTLSSAPPPALSCALYDRENADNFRRPLFTTKLRH